MLRFFFGGGRVMLYEKGAMLDNLRLRSCVIGLGSRLRLLINIAGDGGGVVALL